MSAVPGASLTSITKPYAGFQKGNKGGPGNPFAAKVAVLRAAMYSAVSPEDIQELILALLNEAKGGNGRKPNIEAIKEVLARVLGKPIEADLFDQLEKLQQTVQFLEGQLAARVGGGGEGLKAAG